MTKGCAYDVNECCVELEVGDCNVRWLKREFVVWSVSVRGWWKRECSVRGGEQTRWAELSGIGERSWAESVSGGDQNRWAEVRWAAVTSRAQTWGWLVWRIVRRAKEGIETSGETWRSVRLNVAERAVERGESCGWTWGTRFVLLSWTRSCVNVTFYCSEVTDVRRTDMP